jgi:DNA-binding NarL/FixJ family response regulator
MNNGIILMIDDDPMQLEVTGKMLSSRYQFVPAASGAEALCLANDGFLPDLILLDVAMPGMDGYETFHALRAYNDFADIPVIFLTAMGMADKELKALSMGAVDYVTKPFVQDILLARIALHLETSAELRRLKRGVRNTRKLPENATPLTAWERQIALLAQEWLSQRMIAGRLGLAVSTVHKALNVIYNKLGIHSRRELVEMEL